jgi:hypothetical protein
MSTNDGAERRGEPIDAEFEEAERRSGARRARASQGIGAGAAALLAVVAAGAGAAGGAVAPRVPQISALLDSVAPQTANAPSAASPQATAQAAALDQRLKAVEGVVNAPLGEASSAEDGGAANVTARVFALQSGLRDVETRLQAIPSSQEIGELVGKVQEMEQQLPEIAATSRTAADAARAAFAVAAAAEASRSSGPFEQSYASLQALLPDDPNVAALAPLSRTGAPTRTELRDQFTDVQLNVIRAARQAQAGAGFWGRIQAVLANWITVRQTGQGDTPDGVVERAGQRLSADDLAGAIQELNRLSGGAAQAAKPWLENARRRLAIDTHLAAIRTELSRRG